MLISSPINNLTPTLKITTVTCPSTFRHAEGSRNSVGRGVGKMADRMGLRVDSGRKPWSTVRHAVQRIALPRITFQIWGFKSGAATLVMKNHDRYLSADLRRGGRIPELRWLGVGNNADRMGLRVDSRRKPWRTVRHVVQRIALPRVTFPIWQVGHIEPRDS